MQNRTSNHTARRIRLSTSAIVGAIALTAAAAVAIWATGGQTVITEDGTRSFVPIVDVSTAARAEGQSPDVSTAARAETQNPDVHPISH